MTNKPRNRMKGVLSSSWYYIINQEIIQNSQVVKKKLNLKNQEILLVEVFLVQNSRTKIFPDELLLQNDGPDQYLKKAISRES